MLCAVAAVVIFDLDMKLVKCVLFCVRFYFVFLTKNRSKRSAYHAWIMTDIHSHVTTKKEMYKYNFKGR